MHRRAAQLITSLELAPHPEGGHFREIYRSPSRVRPLDSRSERAALTTIHFLLAAGEVSRWHRVASDEVWHYCEGDPLELLTAHAGLGEIARHRLAPAGEGTHPVQVVSANAWQAARSAGAYTLVTCTVGPGFEFADLQLLRDLPVEAKKMAARQPELALFL
jgi:predicted cupin superfamily sugar epimerase